MDQEQPQQFFPYMAQRGLGHVPGYDPTQAASMGIPALGPFNMLAQPILQAMAGQNGMFMGQFQPAVNLADMLQADTARRQLMQETATAAKNIDIKNWLKTTEGLARMTGTVYGLDQEAGFAQAYRNAAPLLSILGQVAPELLDQLHGSAGSAAVMTQGLFRGGQYRANMLSGIPGLRGADLETLSETISEELYGTPERISKMQGVGMGQLGKIFDEAQRRGYMSSSLSTRKRGDQLDALSKSTGESIEELDQLDAEDFGRKMREFDSKKVAGRLKELAGSITAMRDLFGSMGQGSAPVSQLVNALEALTQNRLASMPATQVEDIVRKTKALMENTGASLDSLVGLTTLAANYGDKIGLDRSLSIQAGQHAVGFESAYKQAFGSDYTAFGALSPDQLGQREAIIGQRAAGSQKAQFAGALINTVENFNIGADTRAGKLAEALKNGETTFEGKSMFEILGQASMEKIMQESTTQESGALPAFRQRMHDKFGNQETIQKYDLGSNVIRRIQPEELIYQSRGYGRGAIQTALLAQGKSLEEAREMSKGGDELLRRMFNDRNPERLSTFEGRKELVLEVLTEQFGEEEAQKMLPAVAQSFESQMNVFANRKRLGNLGHMIQMNNTGVLEQEQQTQRLSQADAEIDKALAPLGRAGPIARVINMIQNDKQGNKEITEVIGELASGIKVEDIRQVIDDTETIRKLGSKKGLDEKDREVLALARDRVRTSVDVMAGFSESAVQQIVTDSGTISKFENQTDLTKDDQKKLSLAKNRMKIKTELGGGMYAKDIDQLVEDSNKLRDLEAGGRADDQEEITQTKARIAETKKKIQSRSAKADVGRVVDDETVKLMLGSADEVKDAIAEKDPTKRTGRVKSAIEVELKRANNFVGTLYRDDASMRKLGPDGVDKLESIERKHTRLLKLVGNDTEMIAKALAGDETVPEALRKDIVSLHGQLERETAAVGKTLGSDKEMMSLRDYEGGAKADAIKSVNDKEKELRRLIGSDQHMIEKAEAGDESIPEEKRQKILDLDKSIKAQREAIKTMPLSAKEKVDALRKERTANDLDQTNSLIDQLAEIGGFKPKSISEEDRKALRSQMGSFISQKRKGIMLAVSARRKLQQEAKTAGVSIADLKNQTKFAEDFRQAGGLADFGAEGASDTYRLQETLKEFEPTKAQQKAGGEQHEMTITGHLDLDTGEIGGTGYTNMGRPR